MQFLKLLEQQRNWSPRILFIDENIAHFREFESIHAGSGYDLHLALNAKASLMLGLQVLPDIIVINLDLHEADPIEMIRFFKSQDVLSNTAIIATSEIREISKIEQALDYGLDDFLLRPYSESLVRKRIRNTLQVIAIQRSDRIQMALSNILEESLNEIFIFDAISYEIFYASRGAAKNLGYSLPELHVSTLTQLATEGTRGQLEETLLALLEKDNAQALLNSELERKDGTQYPVELFLQRSTVFSKPAIVALAKDITQIVQQRAEVERLARAVESSGEAVFITDTQGVIQYVNAAFTKLYGLSANEAVGQTPKIIKSSMNSSSIYQEMWGQLLSGNTWKGALINRRKASRRLSSDLPLLGQKTRQHKKWLDDYRWVQMTVSPIVNQQGDCISYVALQRDITKKVLEEKKQAQRHLHAIIRAGVAKSLQKQDSLKVKLQQVLARLIDRPEYKELKQGCLYLTDRTTRECELVTQYGEFHSPPPKEYGEFDFAEKGESYSVTVSQSLIVNRCQCDDGQQDGSKQRSSHGHYLIPLTFRKEHLGWLVLFCDIYPDDDPDQLQFLNSLGELIGVAVANDRLTNELKTARREAVEANVSKDQFLANVSHEIRTPMTAILGYSEILMEQIESGSLVSMIETIKLNGDYLLSLINDLLDLSKINSGKMTVEMMSCSPAEILKNIETLLKVRAQEKQIEYRTEFEGRIPESIQTDPTRLKQILVNLIGNAIKFTNVGSVRIVARSVEAGPVRSLEISVEDTGVGMTDVQLKKLFQPFTQADVSMARRFGGTGLGLTISKKLAELLKGTITVSSVSGKGTAFMLTIPTGNPEQENLVQYSSPGELSETLQLPDSLKAYCGFSPRILVAEDGVDNQRLISFILKKWECEVEIVENGKLAVSKALAATEQGTPFDLILMDIQMPEMNGYEATRELRTAGYQKPIIALTAHAMTSELQSCLAVGCDAHTSKPINRKELLALICQYVKREHARNV